MITAKEKEDAFRADFAELLTKHKAQLEITDDGKPYGMHSPIAEIWIDAEFDADGNETAKHADFRIYST